MATISQVQHFSKSRLSHELWLNWTSSEWWSDCLLQGSCQYLLFRVWYAQVRECNRYSQNFLLYFTYLCNLFLQITMCCTWRYLNNITVLSDFVFSENSYSKSVHGNTCTSVQQLPMSVFTLTMVTLCWRKDIKKNKGLVKIYYPSTQLFLPISALIKILKSLQVH